MSKKYIKRIKAIIIIIKRGYKATSFLLPFYCLLLSLFIIHRGLIVSKGREETAVIWSFEDR